MDLNRLGLGHFRGPNKFRQLVFCQPTQGVRPEDVFWFHQLHTFQEEDKGEMVVDPWSVKGLGAESFPKGPGAKTMRDKNTRGRETR